MASKEKEERLLILCVDRDDDIGLKTEEKTPILGRKENLNAAISLALKDPEEPDANAIFEAIRVYDQLKRQGQPNEIFQVATISGSQLLGVEADRKLVRELNEVLKAFPANNVILVTDGYSDEAVLPLVESRVPVTSVRRIIVKHSESIEETAALFSKYLKMLIENPRYSRIALGVPGLLLIMLAIMYLGGWLYFTWIAFLIVLGAILLIKGFGIDKATMRFFRWIREYEPPPLPVQIAGFAFAAGILATAVGVFLGINGAAGFYSTEVTTPPVSLGDWISLLPSLLGVFIEKGVYLIVIGICVVLSGRAVYWYFKRDIRLLRTLVITVVIAWSSQMFNQVSVILINPEIGWAELAFTIITGVLLAIAASLITLVINIKYGSFFKKRKKKVEEFEQS
jgi:putative membrane protein